MAELSSSYLIDHRNTSVAWCELGERKIGVVYRDIGDGDGGVCNVFLRIFQFDVDGNYTAGPAQFVCTALPLQVAHIYIGKYDETRCLIAVPADSVAEPRGTFTTVSVFSVTAFDHVEGRALSSVNVTIPSDMPLSGGTGFFYYTRVGAAFSKNSALLCVSRYAYTTHTGTNNYVAPPVIRGTCSFELEGEALRAVPQISSFQYDALGRGAISPVICPTYFGDFATWRMSGKLQYSGSSAVRTTSLNHGRDMYEHNGQLFWCYQNFIENVTAGGKTYIPVNAYANVLDSAFNGSTLTQALLGTPATPVISLGKHAPDVELAPDMHRLRIRTLLKAGAAFVTPPSTVQVQDTGYYVDANDVINNPCIYQINDKAIALVGGFSPTPNIEDRKLSVIVMKV